MLKAALVASFVWLITQEFICGLIVFFVMLFNLGVGAVGGLVLNRIDKMKIDNDEKKKRKQALQNLL